MRLAPLARICLGREASASGAGRSAPPGPSRRLALPLQLKPQATVTDTGPEHRLELAAIRGAQGEEIQPPGLGAKFSSEIIERRRAAYRGQRVSNGRRKNSGQRNWSAVTRRQATRKSRRDGTRHGQAQKGSDYFARYSIHAPPTCRLTDGLEFLIPAMVTPNQRPRSCARSNLVFGRYRQHPAVSL